MTTVTFGHEQSTFQTVISSLAELAWPVVALVVIGLFREPLANLIQSIKKVRYKDWEADCEIEESSASESPEVDILKGVLKSSPHSYEWIRRRTPLRFSDAEFNQFVDRHHDDFVKTTIVRRDSSGNRIPGVPGIKLIPNSNSACYGQLKSD